MKASETRQMAEIDGLRGAFAANPARRGNGEMLRIRLKDTHTHGCRVEVVTERATARTATSSVKDTFSTMSLRGVLYALATLHASEAWRCP